MARMGRQSGAIDEGEAAVIENILTLPNTPVRDIMTPRTVTFALHDEATVEQAQQDERLMVHSRMPVYRDGVDDIVGMVFRRDVLACEDGQTRLHTLMLPVHYVVDKEPVDRTLDLMLKHKSHMLVVLGEFGGFAGVVTLEDVLEEILGEEIVDEFDQVEDMRALASERKAEAMRRTDT